MIEAVLYISIGILIGWNLPQPEWVKNAQDKIKSYFKGDSDK